VKRELDVNAPKLPGEIARRFSHVRTWVFDLDNTLYPPGSDLWPKIDQRITLFMAQLFGLDGMSSRALQKYYYQRYGTTLRGLMSEHDITPDEFTAVDPDERLDRALHALPGRKLVFTNGTVAHAEKVLARIGVTHHFGDIFDIVHSDYIPKPEMEPYRKFVAQTGIREETAAMFEDIARNLEAPHALGMTTVLVVSPENRDAEHLNRTTGGTAQEHIHHITDDLAGFLGGIVAKRVD